MNRRLALATSLKPVPVFTCTEVAKAFSENGRIVKVLHRINLIVNRTERIAIVGPSGSGKSTLLHLLGGLDILSAGQIKIRGQDITQLREQARSEMRNRYLGFIYQFHHLLPEFTALENVCMPLLISGMTLKSAKRLALPLLEQAGLTHRLHHKPSQLSGGERQRTAIVRALIMHPDCILADEPTGNLDSHTAEQVFGMLLSFNQTSLVLVTHDLRLAARMDRVLHLENGELREH